MEEIEQLFPGFRACVMAEIGKYGPAPSQDDLDKFRAVVVGHRDRYHPLFRHRRPEGRLHTQTHIKDKI